MGATVSDRLSRLGYARARRLLLVTGVVVLAVVALVTWARRVDTVEVVATLLFLPIFLAFVLRGVISGDDETILYRGHGRSGPDGLREGVTFQTASDRLGWLNHTVALGRGSLDGQELTIELFQVT